MNDFLPVNALDRAIMGVRRSKAAIPEFYRQLAEGDLWFLVHYHPEVEGELMELKNGVPIPFAVVKAGKEEQVMLFSSEARLEEALKNGRVSPRTFSVGSMPARQILEIIGKSGLWAIVNRSCATGAMIIPPDLMRDLADGSALKPLRLDSEGRQDGRLKILNPADFPTTLVQTAFEFVRQHQEFRVAWVFGTLPPPAQGRGYQLLFFMEPRDKVLFHDLNLAIQAARGNAEIRLGLLNDDDVAGISGEAPPFYTARDYHAK